MIKYIALLVVGLIGVSIYATDLPADFSDGNPLTAAELNSWKDERSGDMYPINPSSNNYDPSANYSLGSSSYRWLNGNFSGVVRADGQPRVLVYPTANLNISDDSNWTTPNFVLSEYDVGDMYTDGETFITIPESGYYYIGFSMSVDHDAGASAAYTVGSRLMINDVKTRLWTGTVAAVATRTSYTGTVVIYLDQNDTVTIQHAKLTADGGDSEMYAEYDSEPATWMNVFKVF